MLVYVNTVDVESLSGPAAVERAVNVTMETLRSAAGAGGLTTTLAHFKLSSHGVTITDNKHRSLSLSLSLSVSLYLALPPSLPSRVHPTLRDRGVVSVDVPSR